MNPALRAISRPVLPAREQLQGGAPALSGQGLHVRGQILLPLAAPDHVLDLVQLQAADLQSSVNSHRSHLRMQPWLRQVRDEQRPSEVASR